MYVGKPSIHESYLKIEIKVEKTEDIVPYVIENDYERIMIVKEAVNMYNSKVIYAKLKRD